MTGPAKLSALDALERAALAADAAENRLRARVAEEVAAVETARRRAFRRYAFLKALVYADAAAPDREASHAAQRAAAAEELDWDEIDAARAPVLDGLAPLAEAVRLAGTGEGADPLAALDAFEAWYERLRGKPFEELFDRYVPETPVVDF